MGTNFLLGLYQFLWFVLFPILRRISRFNLPVRWMAAERLSTGPGSVDNTIWFHCASLGEAKGLEGLLKNCRFPEHQLLLTASTKSGFDYLSSISSIINPKRTPIVRIAPADHSSLVDQFLTSHKIKCLCLYEGELWPNYIEMSKKKNIPVFLVSARIGTRTGKLYSLCKKSFKSLVDKFSWIQAIDEDSAGFLSELTGRYIALGTDYKFLNYFPSGHSRSGSSAGQKGLALVSIHAEELRIIMTVLPELIKQLPVIIFPRHMRELPLFIKLLKRTGVKLFSESPDSRHLLVNSYGKIPELLRRCDQAFNGGTLIPAGGHNLWQLLAEVDSIITGPHFHNQKKLTKKLIEKGICAIIQKPEELLSAMNSNCRSCEIDYFLTETSKIVHKAAGEFIQEFRNMGIMAYFHEFNTKL